MIQVDHVARKGTLESGCKTTVGRFLPTVLNL